MSNPARWGRLFLTACILAALGAVGCSGDETTTAAEETTEEAPPLPPVESMAVDFTAFGGGNLGAGLFHAPAAESLGARGGLAHLEDSFPFATSDHYQEAQDRVDTWNSIIYVAFYIPVVVFISAIDQTPTYQGNLTWLWQYSEVLGGQTWTANLTAIVSSEPAQVTWSMKLTSDPKVLGCCTDFEWFRGVRSSLTSGYWQFYRYAPLQPGQSAEVVRVDWVVTSPADLALTFTNNSDVVPSSFPWGEGSYLRYGINGDTLSLTSKNSAQNNPVVITLDSTTDEGSIVYLDGSMGCWDTNHDDVACP